MWVCVSHLEGVDVREHLGQQRFGIVNLAIRVKVRVRVSN